MPGHGRAAHFIAFEAFEHEVHSEDALGDETVAAGPGVIDVPDTASLYDLLAATLQAESGIARVTPGGKAARVGDIDRLMLASRP